MLGDVRDGSNGDSLVRPKGCLHNACLGFFHQAILCLNGSCYSLHASNNSRSLLLGAMQHIKHTLTSSLGIQSSNQDVTGLSCHTHASSLVSKLLGRKYGAFRI